ncbi:hypothetical protein OSSY52_03290 [Tepiditoga spiralis]|uniref:Uncharacterized protein n=1 Tax=Tepiditoga spiralis TaxID=2108365 RepID=A0A7G1G1Y8_9BACT|nr:hypothetical protein [Tepiditoga spiralis]BBE30188.1 hypothetical protein OSSY52_03290 [Tepiditoga spiralis]
MKKYLLVLFVAILSLTSFSNLIVGGNGWSDIFFGFEGWNAYGGVKEYLSLDSILGEEYTKLNLPLTDIQYIFDGGINYVGFDGSVLLDDTNLSFGSYYLSGEAKAAIGTTFLKLNFFGYDVIPAFETGLSANYYFYDTKALTAAQKAGFGINLLGDLYLNPIFGFTFIFESTEKTDIKITPHFFPWPFMLGVEVELN